MSGPARLLLFCGALVLAPAMRGADDSPLRATELDVCEEVVDRECRGSDRTFPAGFESVSFVTRVEGATGDAFVFHVWTFEGEEVRRIRLAIRKASYRTWSTKKIKNLPGRWKAEILDPLGRSLGAVDFVVLSPAR
jgi:hypothetical protein